MSDFALFYETYPKIAENKTRTVTVFGPDPDSNGLPPGQYTFADSYCVDKGCDCRRTMIQIFPETDSGISKQVGFISLGWEPLAFYRKWLSFNDEEMVLALKGPAIQPGTGKQNPLSEPLLQLFKNVVLTPQLIERYKRHYTIVKMHQRMKIPKELQPYAHTRVTCDCGSGEQFIKCCGKKFLHRL
jgi:hypothetical protein